MNFWLITNAVLAAVIIHILVHLMAHHMNRYVSTRPRRAVIVLLASYWVCALVSALIGWLGAGVWAREPGSFLLRLVLDLHPGPGHAAVSIVTAFVLIAWRNRWASLLAPKERRHVNLPTAKEQRHAQRI